MVEGALGSSENGEVRMVSTPWSKEPMEFEKAAEFGTKKVIRDHSTIGILVTTDGTIGELPRESYIKAEEQVVKELKALNKPFVIVLNSAKPHTDKAQELALSLEEKYKSPVALVNALELSIEDFEGIFELLLTGGGACVISILWRPTKHTEKENDL
jgi:stage IV sporulation protein A